MHFFRKPPPSSGTGSATPLFLRRSSGLVRAFSVFDGFLYAVYADSIIVAAALTYSLTWPWPKANIPLGIVMVCIAFLPTFTVYAMLTSLMPRTGGDYVWQSRAFGGFWGYILVFTPLLFGPWFYMASNVAPGSTMAAVPLLLSFGEIFGSRTLIDFALSLTTRSGMWWFYVLYVTFAAVVLALGMRFYALLQRYSFYAGMTAIGLWVFTLLSTTPSGFEQSYNQFMDTVLHWGDGEAYGRILSMATAAGFTPVRLADTSVCSSFLIGPVLAYTFMYIAWTGTLVGEIGGTGKLRGTLWVYVGGNVFAMIVSAGFVWLLISRIGNPFFSSANFVWATSSGAAMPVPPHYGIFLMSLYRNPWLWLVTAIGLNAWFWIWPTNNIVMSTRVMFAMSFDRMLPGYVAGISRRLGTPLTAIGICYVGCLVMGWLYFFTDFAQLTLNMPLMTAIAFAASTLAGTLFPYLRSTRHIYASSRIAGLTIFGIPLITVTGALGLVYFAIMFYLYITDERYGTNRPLSTIFVLGSIAVSALIYFGYSRYRRAQGIDIRATYRELPSD
jgi:basic amino acid/polyamine antiporter, APA family